MEREEFIKNYYRGQLTDRQQEDFDRLMKSDPEFALEVGTYSDIHEAFRLNEERSLKARFVAMEEERQPEKKKTGTHWYLVTAITIAAVFLLLLNLFSDPSGVELFESYNDVCPNTYKPITRSIENEVDMGFQAYEMGDFTKAEREFYNSLQQQEDLSTRFYYASALLHQDKFKEALVQFDRLAVNEFEYKAESLWYAALIEVRKEEYKEALSRLKKLKSVNPEYKQLQREELIGDLE